MVIQKKDSHETQQRVWVKMIQCLFLAQYLPKKGTTHQSLPVRTHSLWLKQDHTMYRSAIMTHNIFPVLFIQVCSSGYRSYSPFYAVTLFIQNKYESVCKTVPAVKSNVRQMMFTFFGLEVHQQHWETPKHQITADGDSSILLSWYLCWQTTMFYCFNLVNTILIKPKVINTLNNNNSITSK